MIKFLAVVFISSVVFITLGFIATDCVNIELSPVSIWLPLGHRYISSYSLHGELTIAKTEIAYNLLVLYYC